MATQEDVPADISSSSDAHKSGESVDGVHKSGESVDGVHKSGESVDGAHKSRESMDGVHKSEKSKEAPLANHPLVRWLYSSHIMHPPPHVVLVLVLWFQLFTTSPQCVRGITEGVCVCVCVWPAYPLPTHRWCSM